MIDCIKVFIEDFRSLHHSIGTHYILVLSNNKSYKVELEKISDLFQNGSIIIYCAKEIDNG